MKNQVLINCYYYKFLISEYDYTQFVKLHNEKITVYKNENKPIPLTLRSSSSLKSIKSSSSNLCDLENQLDNIEQNKKRTNLDITVEANTSNKRIKSEEVPSSFIYNLIIKTYRYFFL